MVAYEIENDDALDLWRERLQERLRELLESGPRTEAERLVAMEIFSQLLQGEDE